MARRRRKSFGSSAPVHMARGKAQAGLARSHRRIFHLALKAGDCKRALSHLTGAARALGQAAAHGGSFHRRGKGRSNVRAITSMANEFFHSCVVYR